MGQKYAIDFGTTNSVVARWDDDTEAAEILSLPKLSATEIHTGIVPSLLYVNDARLNTVTVGQAVRKKGLDGQSDTRLFRNFKRGIVATPAPEPREIDEIEIADRDAGEFFIKDLIQAISENGEIEELVLTAPVSSFEGYLAWLNDVIDDITPEKIRVIDESTAAALGYAVIKPEAIVLVFDFGGGTLDLSLVQLPEHRRNTGGFLKKLLGNANQHTAKVIAKAGRVIGGSDIDQWILAYILQQLNLDPKTVGSAYVTMLTQCEQAKILLSTEEKADILFDLKGMSYHVTLTRGELESLLEANGFYAALRRVVDKVMHVARQRGIFKEDIHNVLMVGGISLMPSVQQALGKYFTDMAVRADKPFTAVAEGALQVASGFGLEDYLIHSYGLRYLNEKGEHEWDELIPMGSRHPIDRPVELTLSAAHELQSQVEFVIGEIDSESVSMVEVQYEDGQAVFVAQANTSEQKIIPLNENGLAHMMAALDPPGKPGEDRIRTLFTVDDRRRLRVTAVDTQTNDILLNAVPLVTLR